MMQTGCVTPIRFAHDLNRQSVAVASPLNITVQEHSVSYDDRGMEVQMPKQSHRFAKRDLWEAEEEWIEFSPRNADKNTPMV